MPKDFIPFELKRKLFHLLAILILCVGYFFLLEKKIMVLLLLFSTGIIVPLEYFRDNPISQFAVKIFHKIMRPKELNNESKLTGVSYVLGGLLVTSIFFSKEIAIGSWLVLAICDTAASWVGIITKAKQKSFAGSSGFFISALIVYYTYFGILLGLPIHLSHALFICFITAAAEYYSDFLIDDNFLVPVVFASATWLTGL
jgi:dolichol kinase